MSTKIGNFKQILAIAMAAVLLNGCGASPRSEIESSSQAQNLHGILGPEEERLAADSSMLSVRSVMDMTPTSFNLQSWPQESTGLRDIQITGLVVVIDPLKMPWKALDNQKNIRSLKIEAEKIVILGALRWPSTEVTILADDIILVENPKIDVTPVAQYGHVSFQSGMSVGADGEKGLRGSSILVRTKNLKALGERKGPVFIADGGQGQKAGDGWGLKKGDAPTAENTAGSLAQVTGQMAGVVYVNSYCSGKVKRLYGRPVKGSDAPLDVRIFDIFHDQVGVQSWPANGRNAIRGGYPGAGGDGGQVTLAVVNKSQEVNSSLFSVEPGKAGESSGLWLGQRAGQPNPAFHAMYSGGCEEKSNGRGPLVVNYVRHDQTNGADAMSPENPAEAAVGGSFQLLNNSEGDFSEIFQSLKLRYIKDLYYNENFLGAAQNLVQLEAKLPATFVEEPSAKAVTLRSQILNIRNNLMAERDYFGRGRNDAPRFTFEFDMDRYNGQVRNAMTSYYLARLFSKHHADTKKALEILDTTLNSLSENLSVTIDDLDKSQSKMSDWLVKIDSVKDNQTSIEQELSVLRARIELIARENVANRERKAKLFKALNMATAICQVIPAGQPALGLGATLFQSLAQGPKEPGLQGAVEYISGLHGNVDKLSDTSTWKNSQDSWKKFWDKADLANLKGKSTKEKAKYLQDIYKDLSPVVRQVAEIVRPWNQPVVPASEIEAEIRKLEAEDPMFQKVAAQLRELIAKKAGLEDELRKYTGLVDVLNTKITSYIALSAAASGEAVAQNLNEDAELKEVFERLASDQEHRILYLYDEAVRSYNYMTLSQLPRPMNIFSLRAKMNQILESEKDLNAATQALTYFYEAQILQIREALADQLDQANPLLMTYEDSSILTLTETELEILAGENEISVPLTDEFYGHKQNVRIRSIEVLPNSYEFTRTSWPESRFPSIYLTFRLGSQGSFNIPHAKDYFYPTTGNLFRWDHTFKRSGESWHSQENALSNGFRGILSALVSNDRTLEYSPVFSSHAGITDLKVKMNTQKGPYKLTTLSVRVNYSYSAQ